MVEMERRGGDGPAGMRTRQQVKVMRGGRDRVADGVEEKARDSLGNQATSSVNCRSRKGFARLGCGVAKGGDDGAIAVESFSGKQVGLLQCGGRKMERKLDGYAECDFLGHKITDIGDCGVEDGCSVVKEVVDEEVSDTGEETSGTPASSCIARRTRSRMDKLIYGMEKSRASIPEDLIWIYVSDNDGDGGNEEEKDEADIIKGGEDRDDSAVVGNREDKGNNDDSVLSLSVADDDFKMRHRSIPIAKRTRQQIRLLFNEVFGKRRKLGGKFPRDSKLSPEIIDVCDDDSKDDSQIIKEANDVEENTGDSLRSLTPSCATRVMDSMHTVSKPGDDNSLNFNHINEEITEEEDKDEDEEDVIVGGTDKEDSVGQGSREDETNQDDSSEHMSDVGEGAKDSEKLLLICSSEEENDVPRNKCYLVDEFGNSYSNNDNSMDDSVQENSGEDQHSNDDFAKYRSVDGEEGGDSDKELLLSSSSDKNNVFSTDPSANIIKHRMPACVLRRTRSCFKMTRSDITKAGTFSNPCCLDSGDDDDQKIALHDNLSSGESNKRRLNSASKARVECMQISEGKGEQLDRSHDRKLIRHIDGTGKIQLAHYARENGDGCKEKSKGRGRKNVTPSKRKHIPQACDAREVLLETIWSQRDTLHESLNIAVPKVKRITNWKFTFDEEDSQPTEQLEAEQEFDKLWMEFEFCLRSCEVESANTDMAENGNLLQPILDSCLRGNHDSVLDEEIGFRCRHCSIILQEIRDVVAPFRKDPVERYVKRDFGRVDDDDFFGKLPNESKTNDLNHDFPSNLDGTVWDLIPGIKNTLYPHQQEGFKFIWKNVAGAVNLSELRRLKESNDGSGCIISHAPGTGKSRLTIVFLQAYLKFFPDCLPVIIAPKSMLLTWEEEFKKWNVDIPFHNLNNIKLSGKEDAEALGVLARLNNGSPRKVILRMVKLYSWKCQSAVLGISYSLFEKLTLGRNMAEDERSEGNVLLKLPGILVLDEGHTPRNTDSRIWQALSNVRTEKRICLSGTPFQNNFQELFNTFCTARPRFAATMSHSKKVNGMRRRGRKSTVKANWANLINSICENNVEELEKLKAMISPFVHVYKGNVLQDTLPGLRQRVVYLRPGTLQKSLLQTADAIGNVIERRHIASLISVHPSLLLLHSSTVITELFSDIREELEGTKLTPRDGAKTKFLTEFLRLTDVLKEKVLVFSDYIISLMFLKDQLKSCFGWTEGEEILYMDGKLNARQRQASISIFNEEDSNAKVLLASTRACCEGISLVGASRVVLLDAAWNPSVQRQAISRAYRIGQKRFVYVYYLITYATIEEDVYRQQVNKDRLSNMVFPLAKESDINGHSDSNIGRVDQILLEMLQHSAIANSIEKVV